MEAILNKLDDLENKLQKLKSLYYYEGKDEYRSITQLLERIIDRIYPEKDAKEIKRKLYSYVSSEGQTDYENDIDRAIRVIGTIKGEYELFGFDSFKPLKEKVKTEMEIGIGNIARFKKIKEK